MNKKITIVLFTAVVAMISLLSHSNGVAEEQNKDRTGAPGSSQPCTHCHTPGGPLNPTSSISVVDNAGIEVTEYIPGNEYQVTFTVVESAAGGFGFQATAILADESNAGVFTNPGADVQLQAVGSRHIVEHSTQSMTGIFNVTWTAPAAESGEVGFFMAAMAVNLAYGNSGDSHVETALTITEAVNGVDELVCKDCVQPIVSSEGISWKAHTNGTLSVYDLVGRLRWSNNVYAGETVNVPSSLLDNSIQIINFIPQIGSLEDFTPQTWKVVIPK